MQTIKVTVNGESDLWSVFGLKMSSVMATLVKQKFIFGCMALFSDLPALPHVLCKA